MFEDVRAHYRKSGELDEGQVCRNMMVTRVDDFKLRLGRCRVDESNIHGDGLYASRDLAEGELITFFPADALLIWEDGNRAGSDTMVFFGKHVPQSERDAGPIIGERVKQYELYASGQFSAVGDPARRDDPAYLGHFANDACSCLAPDDVERYRRESQERANAEAVVVENCHFALRATKPIAAGEEVLRSYGEGYWLARAGHAASPDELARVGAGPPTGAAAAEAQLKRAVARSRPAKRARKAGGGGGRKKKTAHKKPASNKPAAKGFG